MECDPAAKVVQLYYIGEVSPCGIGEVSRGGSAIKARNKHHGMIYRFFNELEATICATIRLPDSLCPNTRTTRRTLVDSGIAAVAHMGGSIGVDF